MMALGDGSVLRVYVSERDKHGHLPLYEWIIQQARDHGLAGATAFRGIEGFGAQGCLHTSKVLRLADDLPILIEIVDAKEKIEAFLPILDRVMSEGFFTIGKVEIRWYRSGQPPEDPTDEPAA